MTTDVRPVRVGLLLPTLHFGGAERWSLDLTRCCDPSRVSWTGCVVLHGRYTHEWMLAAMSVRMTVHVANAGSREEDLASAIERLLGSADVVVTWEVDDHARVLLDQLDAEIVQVAHRRDPVSLTRHATESDHYVAVWSSCVDVFGPDIAPRIEVIPNGVDLNRTAPARDPRALRASWGCSERTLVLGYLGRIDPQKNLEALAHATRALGIDALGIVIGSWSRGAEKIVDALRDESQVRVLPAISDVGTALAAIDVFFLPSRAEVLSLSLLEAWAARRPVVATRVGAVPDLERRLGSLVVPIDPDAGTDELAAAVSRATSDDPNLAEMRDRAAGLVWREFNLNRMGTRWTDYLLKRAREAPPKEEP